MDPAKVWHFCAEWALLRVTNCTGTGGAARRHQEIYVRSERWQPLGVKFIQERHAHSFIYFHGLRCNAHMEERRNSVRRNKIFCNKLYVGEGYCQSWPINYIISFNVLTRGQTGLCRHAECEYSAHVNRTDKHILLPLFKLNIEIGKTQKTFWSSVSGCKTSLNIFPSRNQICYQKKARYHKIWREIPQFTECERCDWIMNSFFCKAAL